MLLSFRVANHRSFRQEQELLLLPAYDKTAPATPVAAIYGANASGKSNLLDALRAMRTAVLDSFARWEPLGGVPRDPFTLTSVTRQAESSFGVDLLLGRDKYVYGFAVDDARVTEEWLYHYPRGRRRVLFERTADHFTFGDSLRGPKNVIEEVTRPNSLFLSAAAHHRMDQLLAVYSWFSRRLTFAGPDDHASRRDRTIELLRSPAGARRIVTLLRAADLGITDARANEPDLSHSGRHDRAAWVKTRAIDEHGVFLDESWPPEVEFIRETTGGSVSMGLEQESNGTRTWFDLLGLITDTLDNGWVLAVDELDASLHPLLVREFVRLFQRTATNPHGAQLIFTTHDTSLLARHQGEEVLRRDEIWFTEKNTAGETQLYPLTDFKPRTGLNWERRYLGGSVGAVPFLDQENFAAATSEGRSDDE